MSVLEQAFDLYESQGWHCEDLYLDMILYRKEGGMIFTDTEIMLYRAVHTKWDEDYIIDFEGKDPKGDRNCWYVHLGVSENKPLIDYMPYWLPYICFVHRNRFRIIPTKRLYGQKEKSSTSGGTSTSSDPSTTYHHGDR